MMAIPILAVILMSGCSSREQTGRISKSINSSHVTAQSKKYDGTNSQVGKVLSQKKGNVDIAYKMANKQVKFYRNLKSFGKKSGVIATYQGMSGTIYGVREKYTTTTGTFYHLVSYQSVGFDRKALSINSAAIQGRSEEGYVKASDMKRVYPVVSEWTYSHKQPYYIANPYSHRLWNYPTYTRYYTYVSHVFDRLTTTQLYATKELIKHTGKHYVYLETAKGRPLGWVLKKSSVLIAGKYRVIDKQLLKVGKHESKLVRIQSRRSTKNHVTTNDSMATQQRVYLIRNRQHQIKRVLVIGMDNRATKVTFKHGQATKLVNYTYRRRPWKTVTSKRRLRTHYTAEHLYINSAATRTKFYSTKNIKLVNVMTMGEDGYATAVIYRNGHVSFVTEMPKDLQTYPIADFD